MTTLADHFANLDREEQDPPSDFEPSRDLLAMHRRERVLIQVLAGVPVDAIARREGLKTASVKTMISEMRWPHVGIVAKHRVYRALDALR